MCDSPGLGYAVGGLLGLERGLAGERKERRRERRGRAVRAARDAADAAKPQVLTSDKPTGPPSAKRRRQVGELGGAGPNLGGM